MLPPPDITLFQKLVQQSNREQLAWMAGYLAAQLQNGTATEPTAAEAPPAVSNRKITLLYGTETGNAKRLATKFAATAKKHGIGVKLAGLDQYKLADLPKEEYLFAVVSTQGDGEPPASAKKFYEQLQTETAPLQKLKYGVLGLGDTSYPLFCQAAEDLDTCLQKMGGERIIDLQKCDTDYEVEAGEWFVQVAKIVATPTVAPVISVPTVLPTPARPTTHKKIHTGTITENFNLNDIGSAKQTHHIVITTDAATDYAPGDSVGFVPHNSTVLVENILQLTGLDKAKKIRYKEVESTAETLLTQRLNLVYLPERVVAKYAAIVGQEIPAVRMDLLDLLRIYPVQDAAQLEEVIKTLEPITPRLYSISSSPAAHPEEIHITVSRNTFAAGDEQKWGLCSDFLVAQVVGSEVHFYIHHNAQFKLPPPDKDVIMIGPGTGIAPFRSFLAERDATGADGRNWLFFGEQHFVTDFLYQTEIQRYAETGVLNRVNVAFSRDQKEKLYVQHRMQQQAETLWEWLNNGASLYVCGAREPMSIDVETTLLTIIEQQGNLSPEAAAAWLNELEEAGRYLKDVY